MASASRCGLSNTEKNSALPATIKAAASLTTFTRLRTADITPQYDEKPRKIPIDSVEQPVEGQSQQKQDHPGEELADHPKTEEPFVRNDVVDRCLRIRRKQLVRNVRDP